MFKVASIPIDKGARMGSLFIDLKARYLFGTQAEYLREGDVQITSTGHVVLHPQKSKTDLLTAHIGVIFYF